MAIEHCELAHGAYPPATSLPSVADGVGTWANGAWHEIESSAASDRIVTGLAYRVGNAAGEFDLGVGAAGSEVVKATIRVMNRGNERNTQQWIAVPVPGAWIASGDRTAWRVRHDAFDLGTGYGVAYTAYEETPTDAVSTTQVLKRTPAASSISVIPSGTAWSNGAWKELVASTSAAWVLAYLVSKQSSTQFCTTVEFDIGVGASGSETVVTTVRQSGAHEGMPTAVKLAFDGIASGSRVAIRVRQDGTFTNGWTVAVGYQEKPL